MHRVSVQWTRLTLLLLVALLLALGSAATLAQDEQAEQTPEATAPLTDFPTDLPPTEAPTSIPTDIPPIEATAEATVEPTLEVPAETTPDVTEVPTAVPSATPPGLPDEPALALLYADSFADGTASAWTLGEGWTVIASEADFALQGGSSALELALYDNLLDVAVQARLWSASGAAHLNVRASVVGSYTAELLPEDTVNLYRAGVLLQTAAVPPLEAGPWRSLRLSAIGGTLRVAVDGVEVLALEDPAPLPPGKIVVSGGENAMFRLDDVQVWLPADQPIPPTAVLAPAIEPTAETTPVVTPELPSEVTPEATAVLSAPRVMSGVFPAGAPMTFVVNTKDDQVYDGVCDATHCTLREAIEAANANTGVQDTIAFAIPGTGPFTIFPFSCDLPPIGDPVIIDGYTDPLAEEATDDYPATIRIAIDGYSSTGMTTRGTTTCTSSPNGLKIIKNATVDASGTIIRGLSIARFKGHGILVEGASNVTIEGNFIGLEVEGSAAYPNVGDGVHIKNGPNTMIGGFTAAKRNVISGNTGDGIEVEGTSPGTRIVGNFIGLDKGSTTDRGNTGNGVRTSTALLVGGAEPGARNIISGNTQNGVLIALSGAHFSEVKGNYIGLNAAGTMRIPNDLDGVQIFGAGAVTIGGTEGVTVGGPCTGACNVITGNGDDGIEVAPDSQNNGYTGNYIAGNFIGTNPTGTGLVTTAGVSGNAKSGIRIRVSGTWVGGTTPAERNIISGNQADSTTATYGIVVLNSTESLIYGNYIGTDVTGSSAVPNKSGGILMQAPNNKIGDLGPQFRNVISGNNGFGIEVSGSGTNAVRILGNYVGVNAAGTNPLPNVGDGIRLNGAKNNFIGDRNELGRNIISGNTGDGIEITGAEAEGNRVQTNYIGVNATNTGAIPNGGNGVRVTTGAKRNLIGLDAADDPKTIRFYNIIANNGLAGIAVESSALTGMALMNNIIRDNGGLGIDLGAAGVTLNDPGDADTGPNNLQNYPKLTTVSRSGGVVTIQATLDTIINRDYRVDFFANTAASCDPSGYGEGPQYLGSAFFKATSTVTAFSQTFNDSEFDLLNADFFTMTATDYDKTDVAFTEYNTSEFSRCVSRYNNLPTISDIPNLTTRGNLPVVDVPFTVGDVETPAGNLVLSVVSSSNETLVPVTNVVFGGSGANRTLTVRAADGQSPTPPEAAKTSVITIRVTDGGGAFEDETFVLTVTPNYKPTITAITAKTTAFNTAITVPISVNDTEADDIPRLVVTATNSTNTALVPLSNIQITGYGTAWQAVITPAVGQTGTSTLTITVSDTDKSNSTTFTLTVSANKVPTITSIANQTMVANTVKVITGVTLADTETAPADLILTVVSTNETVLPNDPAHIQHDCIPGASSSVCTITLTPATGQVSSAFNITATVSDGYATASRTFTLTVTNSAPTISPTTIPAQATVSNTPRLVLVSGSSPTITITDTDTAPNLLVVTATSDNLTLLPNNHIALTCAPATATTTTCTLTLTPAPNQIGTANVTFSVTDNIAAPVTRSFAFNVSANQPPCISGTSATNNCTTTVVIPAQNTTVSTPKTVTFYIDDPDKAITPLTMHTITATSSNTTLVPNANIVPGGSGATRTVTITPVGQVDVDTNVTITLRVSDGDLWSEKSFVLTVKPGANTPPTITTIPDQTTTSGVPKLNIPFTVGDVQTAPDQLVVTAVSNNQTLLPNANIVLGGSGADRTISVTPAAGKSGTATVTVSVTDKVPAGQTPATTSKSFLLTVVANTPPEIFYYEGNQTLLLDEATPNLPFTVQDAQTPASLLVVTATSDNTTLVPNNPANLVLSGAGSNRFIQIVPVAGQSGTASITLEVRDEANAVARKIIIVTVTPNTPPTISDILDRATTVDTPTGPIPFTVSDIQTKAEQLIVTASSSNPAIVPNDAAHLTLGGAGSARSINVTPVNGQLGTVDITVSVTDGHSNTTSDTFKLTVTTNNPPTISAIADVFVAPGTVVGPIIFVVNDAETDPRDLVMSATSSNPALLPDTNIVFGGTLYERTVTLYPVAGVLDTSSVVVTVTDGATVTASAAFTLTTRIQPPVPNLPAHLSTVTVVKPPFSWSAVAGAKAYELQIDTASDFSSAPTTILVTGTSHTPANPLNQRVYYWRVRALNAANQPLTPWSIVPSFTLNLLKTPANRSFTTDTTPTFTWGPGIPGSAYTLEVGTSLPSQPGFTPVPLPPTCLPTATTCTLIQPLDDGVYYWRVKVNGDPTPIYAQFIVTQPPPTAPTLVEPLAGTFLNTATPTLKWNKSASTAALPYSYDIQIDNQSTFASPDFVHNTGVQTDTQMTLTVNPALSNNGQYYWRVRAVNKWGVPGAWSAARTFTVDTIAPAAPIIKTPVDGFITNDSTPTFTWTLVAGAKRYTVEISASSDFSALMFPAATVTTATYTVPNASALPNGTYYWRLKAFDAANNASEYTTTRAIIVSILKAPANGASSTNQKPTLSWMTVTTGTRYTLQIATDTGFSNLMPVPASCQNTLALSCLLTQPLPHGRYYWRVNVNGVPAERYWLLIITPPLPAAPVLLLPANLGAVTDNTPTLTWKPTISTQGAPYTYEIQVDNVSTFLSPEFAQSGITGTYVTVTTALPDGKYYWRARTINTYGAPSAWTPSRTLTVDTLPPPVPVLKTPDTNAILKDNTPTLTWVASVGANRYRVDIATDSAFTSLIISGAQVATVSYTVPNALALPNGVYYWRVRAVDAAGNVSAPSAARLFHMAAP